MSEEWLANAQARRLFHEGGSPNCTQRFEYFLQLYAAIWSPTWPHVASRDSGAGETNDDDGDRTVLLTAVTRFCRNIVIIAAAAVGIL
jgi:hypothetical protein